MLELFENILEQSAGTPLLTAFILGLLAAFNPCQLGINISALAYLQKDTDQGNPWQRGLIYLAGRSTTYVLLGWLLGWLLNRGKDISYVGEFLSKGETWLPYVLLLLAALFFWRFFHHHHHDDSCHNCNQVIQRHGQGGAWLLGLLLAFVFCPESAVFYFAMLLPLGTTTPYALLLPVLFALAAGLPVILLLFLFHSASAGIHRLERQMELVQRWVNMALALLFLLLALLFL